MKLAQRLICSAAFGLALATACSSVSVAQTAPDYDLGGTKLAADIGISSPSSQTPSQPQKQENSRSTTYCDRNLGTWFYCEDPEPDPDQQQKPDQATAPKSSPEADLAAANKFKEDMEKARVIAVWNPTPENIRRFYAFQQVTVQKSGLFADSVRRMIWENPELDYTRERPVADLAKTSYQEVQQTDRDLFFRGAYDQIGVFYIYRGSCPACKVASPIIRSFSNRYGLPVKAISTDGSPNPEFPEFLRDQGQLASWGITNPVTPAYLVYQKPTLGRDGSVQPVTISVSDGKRINLRPCENPRGCVTYIGAGVLTMDELADRLYVTLATEPGKDF